MAKLPLPALLPVLFVMLALAAGCQREEPPPLTGPAKKPGLHVVVPPEVKARWKAVRIVAHDRQTGRDLVYTVDVGGRFVLADSGMQVEVTHFLPAFVTDGRVATSTSSELRNPGVEVVIREAGTVIFRGWILRNAPADHAFRHPRFSLALQDFVARR